MDNLMNIGILGGTFNPIHIGHLVMGQVALEKIGLDKVIFIPSNIPPHKNIRRLASARHRYEMVKLSISDNPHFAVSDLEIRRPGKSYTIDTVVALKKEYPSQTRFYFIIGGDSVDTLSGWKDIERLKKMVKFVALNRPGFKPRQTSIRVKSLVMPSLEISSSYLRNCFSSGGSAMYLLRYRVVEYIQKNCLYR
jgi:nicotinate-nucleotide adenylyltransferase